MSDKAGFTEVLEGEVGDLVTSGKKKGEQRIFELAEPLPLESGEELAGIQLAYRTWGAPAAGGGARLPRADRVGGRVLLVGRALRSRPGARSGA